MRKQVSVLLVFVLVFLALLPSGFAGDSVGKLETSRYGDVADIGPWLKFQAKDEALRAKLDEQVRQAALKVNFDEEASGDEEDVETASTYDGGSKMFLG